MKQAIFFLTNRIDNYVTRKISEFMELENENMDFFLLYHSQDGEIPQEFNFVKNVFVFSSDLLYSMGYVPISDNIVIGNCHFPFLKCYLDNNIYDYFWLIEDDVVFSGSWKTFFDNYIKIDADFLTADVRGYEEDKDWMWWDSIRVPEQFNQSNLLASFNPICRISNKAFEVVNQRLKEGWRGHTEVIIPTILKESGLTIKDMKEVGFGGSNCTQPVYNRMTHNCVPLIVQDIKPNMIYHPVKKKQSKQNLRKYCVISVVGRNSCHPEWIMGKKERNFDLHLLVYDMSYGLFYNDADYMSYKQGEKWELIYDYLMDNPKFLSNYEYFFFPDEDLKCDVYDIEHVFACMEEENIQIAQPSLRNSYSLSTHVLRHPNSKLRYTNYVEPMAPCFSRNALNAILPTFNSGEIDCFHWAEMIHENKTDMAIIDEVGIQRCRPMPLHYPIPINNGTNENKCHLGMKIREYSCIPSSECHLDANLLKRWLVEREKKREVLCELLCELTSYIKAGLILKQGIYGKYGVGILLWLFSEEFELKCFRDYAETIFQQIDSCPVTLLKDVCCVDKDSLLCLLDVFRIHVKTYNEIICKYHISKENKEYYDDIKKLVQMMSQDSLEYAKQYHSELNDNYSKSWSLLMKCLT